MLNAWFIQDIKAKKEHYYKTKVIQKLKKNMTTMFPNRFWGLIVIFIMAILIGYSFQGFIIAILVRNFPESNVDIVNISGLFILSIVFSCIERAIKEAEKKKNISISKVGK